jgi:hypothetical protein
MNGCCSLNVDVLGAEARSQEARTPLSFSTLPLLSVYGIIDLFVSTFLKLPLLFFSYGFVISHHTLSVIY